MADVTCYTIIGRDLGLLQWNVLNARKRAGMPHEWLVVNWVNPADDPACAAAIQAWCESESVRYVRYPGTREQDYPSRTAWFLHDLYASWNLGYAEAQTPWVARMGSDQFFARDWLKWLWTPVEHFGERAVYDVWTVESPLAVRSRHPIEDFGVSPQTFDTRRFDEYAATLQNRYSSRYLLKPSECRLYYQHPTRGLQVRTDGVTWLQTRALWEKHGPLPDAVSPEGIAPDVAYRDRLFDAGIPSYLVPPAVAWHAVRGESRDLQA